MEVLKNLSLNSPLMSLHDIDQNKIKYFKLYQVIARENKSGSYGIDYKFSDMINNFAKGGKQSGDAEITTRSPTRTVITTMRTPTSTMRSSLPANLQQRAPPSPPTTTTTTTSTLKLVFLCRRVAQKTSTQYYKTSKILPLILKC